MTVRTFSRACAVVGILCVVGANSVLAQHHHMPHPPQPPVHQPPVFVPPPPAPTVPPVLRAPQRPDLPPKLEPDTANTPDAPTQVPEQGIDKENVPKFVYTLGDSADIKAFFEPPAVVHVGEDFCDWQCEAKKMFPDAEDPNLEYTKWADEQYRIREERLAYLSSGDAIPEELRIGYWHIDDIKVRKDENGNERFFLRVQGIGQEAIFSVAADDIDGGIAANIEKIRSIASYNALWVEDSAEFNRSRGEAGTFTEAATKRYLALAEEFEAQLRAYGGPIAKRENTSADRGTTAGPTDAVPTPEETPSSTEPPLIPIPEVNDPTQVVDAILADDTSLFDPALIGGMQDPALGSDAMMEELVRASRDFGNQEVLIDIDVVDNGNLAELTNALAHATVDVSLAVAGAVNPAAGLAIAFGKNAKETYDYAISKGLSTKQAIFAATAAGAVGGADTYVMGLGIGKVAGWSAKAIKGATKTALNDGIGTAGNASGFSLVGNVGKALVDKIVADNANPNKYRRPPRTQPLGTGQVTVIMSGGGNWQQNAMQ
jgi:hypothetical protein